MPLLGQKALDCLKLIDLSFFSDEGQIWFNEISTKYSEKAVYMKLEELESKGYLDSGVTTRSGWLTIRGKRALEEAGIPVKSNPTY